MAGITLAQAEANLAAAQAAYTAALNKKSYGIGTRQLTTHDIDKLRQEMEYWDGRVQQLARGAGGMRIRGATPT